MTPTLVDAGDAAAMTVCIDCAVALGAGTAQAAILSALLVLVVKPAAAKLATQLDRGTRRALFAARAWWAARVSSRHLARLEEVTKAERQRAAVAALLVGLFNDEDDLRRFIRTGPHGATIAGDLPGDASLRQLADAAVELVLLNHDFYARLRLHRPGRADEIDAVEGKAPEV